MEEIEVPLEKVHEQIQESAHHTNNQWVGRVALFSAIVAVIAAVAALLAGHHSNEAMITQIRASDSWNYYQAKGIKSAILQSKNQLLAELGKDISEKDQEKINDYKKEQDEIQDKGKELETESNHHLLIHQILARSVTLFQVAIALSAITILTKKRRFFYVSIGFSLVGLGFFIQGLLK